MRILLIAFLMSVGTFSHASTSLSEECVDKIKAQTNNANVSIASSISVIAQGERFSVIVFVLDSESGDKASVEAVIDTQCNVVERAIIRTSEE